MKLAFQNKGKNFPILGSAKKGKSFPTREEKNFPMKKFNIRRFNGIKCFNSKGFAIKSLNIKPVNTIKKLNINFFNACLGLRRFYQTPPQGNKNFSKKHLGF